MKKNPKKKKIALRAQKKAKKKRVLEKKTFFPKPGLLRREKKF